MPIVRSRQQVFRAGPLDNENGLVGWWPFDDNSALDVSGRGINGTLVNSPTSVGGLIRGNALNFDGSTQYVDIGTSLNSIFNGASYFSATYWITPASGNANNYVGIISKKLLGDNTHGPSCNLGGPSLGDQTSAMFAISNGTNAAIYTATGTLPAGVRKHVACVFDGTLAAASRGQIYIDGVLVAATVFANFAATIDTNNYSWIIANDPNNTNRFFKGVVDDVRIYNRVLTPAEINAIYNQGLSAFSLSPDEWEMPILQAAASAFPYWAVQNNLPVLGTGTY